MRGRSHALLTAALAAAAVFEPAAQAPKPAVALFWLDQAPPAAPHGVSFGVPWARGAVSRGTNFSLSAGGEAIPVQSWPLAYWPDGSLKWTGHAVAASSSLAGPLTLSPGTPAAPRAPVTVTESDGSIDVDTGIVQCRVPRRAASFLASIAIAGRVVGRDGRLVVLREDRARQAAESIVREEAFESAVTRVTVEQRGPVRAVLKVEGVHRAVGATREWLPFVLRLYFHSGLDTIRIVHSFVFDGNQERDFIRGIGVRFSVPMREQVHNRHVRLAGETGLFAEPLRLIAGRRNPSPDLYASQIAGRRIPDLQDLPGRANVEQMAVWDDYKLVQISADSYTVQKRTGAHSSWIAASAGRRALGTVFAGDVSGGLAVGMKHFWQLAPSALEIAKASTAAADVTAWLWSPDAPAMDLRHYDVVEHGLEASYEDIEQGFSTATGIARTTELTVRAFAGVPPNADLLDAASITARTPQLVAAPAYYHSIPVFGVWSLPNRSTPGRAWIEDQLDAGVGYYQRQIEQRRWYGFWDFGDVMHSYDATRHQWRYDVGGFAWANTELMPDLWLWYTFLRTGRADVFRMAEAMTRHTQEVDVYHLGRFAGLGSRHNVRHWGDGAKEARISQALLKRIYYYLTADERTGDLMDEVIDADVRTAEIDPLRKYEPKTQYPTHARVGPDWFAFVSNWFTAWERTGDAKYRNKIVTGMHAIAAMPTKLFSGPSFGYDPKTGMLYKIHDSIEVPHLAALMGGPELNFEIVPLMNVPAWTEAWLHYCRLLQAPEEEQRRVLGAAIDNGRGAHYAKMTAWAAHATKDPALAARAWQEFLRAPGPPGAPPRTRFASSPIAGPDVPIAVDESPRVSTNDAAQWSLNAIVLLELVGDALPALAFR